MIIKVYETELKFRKKTLQVIS